MGTDVEITIYHHDDETTETLTLKDFAKRFNNEQMSDSIYSVLKVTYGDDEIINFDLGIEVTHTQKGA